MELVGELFPNPSKLVDAIDTRFSTRDFDKSHATEQEKMALMANFVRILNKVDKDVILHVCYVNQINVEGRSDPFKHIFFLKNISCADVMACIEVRDTGNTLDRRPTVDFLIGLLGELFILYATSIGLQSVWLGGEKIWFDPKVCANAFNIDLENSHIPICFAIGHALKPNTIIRPRKSIANVIAKSPDGFPENYFFDEQDLLKEENKDILATFKRLQRAPSARNVQPYKIGIAKNVKSIFTAFYPLSTSFKTKKATFMYLTHWLDVGIIAAHAAVIYKNSNPKNIVSFNIDKENGVATVSLQCPVRNCN